MKFNIPEKFAALAALQITSYSKDPDAFERLSRAQAGDFWHFVLWRPVTRAVDFMCGLGRMAIWLDWLLQDHPVEWLLIDVDQDNRAPRYGFDRDARGYNDMALTEEFCAINNLRNFRVYDLNAIAAPGSLLPAPCDLLLSVLAVGFHLPIERFKPLLHKLGGPDTRYIFQIEKPGLKNRRNIYSERSFRGADLVKGETGDYLVLTGVDW